MEPWNNLRAVEMQTKAIHRITVMDRKARHQHAQEAADRNRNKNVGIATAIAVVDAISWAHRIASQEILAETFRFFGV
jgi:hypothetical protein